MFKFLSITQRPRLPAICILCHCSHRKPQAICEHCYDFFTPLGPACYYCATPVVDNHFLVCGQCSINKPPVDHTLAAYRFEEPLRHLLHEFKYHEGLYLCSFFAKIIENSLSKEEKKTHCLIPIPMHPQRLRTRGFNHAAELTKQLARSLKIPCLLTHCEKKINTMPQAGLTAKERRKNIRHAFSIKPLPYQHITLIDDLITTGSTVYELARQLKKQGVQRVDVWCAAKTVT